MRGELVAIERPAERLRFALGCTRVVLLPSATTRAALTIAAAAGLVALSDAIGPTIPLVLLLALLASLGRSSGHLGPVRGDRAARAVRAGGWALVLLCVLLHAVGEGASGVLRAESGSPFMTLSLALLAAAFLAVTARGAGVSSVALGAGASAGLVTGLAGFAVMPFERIASPLAEGLPGQGRWLVLIVFAALAAAALLAGARTLRTDQGVLAAVCAGTFASLVVALLGFGAIVLVPGSVPDIVGSVMTPGTTAAARHAADAREASDPYWGFLVFGSMLATALWAVARPPARADLKLVLLTLLVAPPVALAVAAGADTIAFATATVALAAAVTTRREAAGAS
jgi:hypothetical protein